MSKASESSNISMEDESVTVFGAMGESTGVAQAPYFLQSNVSRRSLSRQGPSIAGRSSIGSIGKPSVFKPFQEEVILF